jgi:DNA mismatch repair ATPase MutL
MESEFDEKRGNRQSKPIRNLDDYTSRLIYASTRIPSYHKAVEELIKNSLCSYCNKIDIIVDIENAHAEVVDDGKYFLEFKQSGHTCP